MTRLEATLDDIVGKLRENHFPNEQSVSQGVVVRVLRDLDWPDHDTQVVWPEYSTGEGRVDYALCHPSGKPRIFIEVKQPGGARRGVKQALEYAFHTGVQFLVLTDGTTWRFYLPMKEGVHYEERLVFVLDLLERPREQSADTLRRYLERSRVISGDAIRVAEDEYNSQRNRANIRTVWNDLVDKHEKSLIDLLADSVEAKGENRPEDSDVIAFLASLRQQSSASLAPPRDHGTNTAERPPAGAETPDVTTRRDAIRAPAEAATSAIKRRGRPSQWDGQIIRSTTGGANPRRRGSKGWHAHNFIMEHPNGVSYEDYRAAEHASNHLAWDLKRGWIAVEKKDRSSPLGRETNAPVPPTTDTKIANVTIPRRGKLRILGEEIAYKNAMDAVLIILKQLQERDRNFLLNFYRHPRNKGTRRRHVAKKTEELYEKKPDLRKYNAQIDDGWLLATNQNKQGKKAILQIAVEVTGLTLGRDIVVDL